MQPRDNDWEGLTRAEQEAAVTLGYTQKLWDENYESAAGNKKWTELTEKQKQAALDLGYSGENDWDTEKATYEKDWNLLTVYKHTASLCYHRATIKHCNTVYRTAPTVS